MLICPTLCSLRSLALYGSIHSCWSFLNTLAERLTVSCCHTVTSIGCPQVPVPPLQWESIYPDATRPLAVDIGCGELHVSACCILNSNNIALCIPINNCCQEIHAVCAMSTRRRLLSRTQVCCCPFPCIDLACSKSLPVNLQHQQHTAMQTVCCMLYAGPGRFPLALAAKLSTHNVLGIDIRRKASQRSDLSFFLLYNAFRLSDGL